MRMGRKPEIGAVTGLHITRLAEMFKEEAQ